MRRLHSFHHPGKQRNCRRPPPTHPRRYPPINPNEHWRKFHRAFGGIARPPIECRGSCAAGVHLPVPWASDLYTLLAQPLLTKLPKGGQMIATDVTTPFFVPLKVALMAAFLIALPYILYQIL